MDQGEALKGLIAGVASRTLAARLRSIMPEVDQRVRAGVRYDEIIAVLNANGFALNRNTFRSYLYRYRKRAALSPETPSARSAPAPPTVAPLTSPAVRALSEPRRRTCSELDDVLDRARRNEIGEAYLARQRPILKSRK